MLSKIANFVKPSNTTSTGLKKAWPIGMSKLIYWVKLRQREIFLSFCIVLISFVSFNLGRINALKKTPITITEQEANVFSASDSKPPNINAKIDRRVVASKNSDKYHFTWCSGAKRIKEANQIWFETEALAQAAGYVKAGNCN